VPGDDNAQATLSNGQIFIQKATDKYQYFIQAWRLHHADAQRAVCLTPNTVNSFYGPVPVAFLKLPVGKTTQFPYRLPSTLMGAESTLRTRTSTSSRALFGTGKRHQSRHSGESNPGQVPGCLGPVGTTVTIPTATRGSRLGDLTKGLMSGVRRDAEPRTDRPIKRRATPIANNSLHARGDLYIHQRARWIIPVLPVQQAADQSRR